MGFFSDFLSMAVSEVANAVMDGVNESMNAQEEQKRKIEEYKDLYNGDLYDNLHNFLNSDSCSGEQRIAVEQILNERKELASQICSATMRCFLNLMTKVLLNFMIKYEQTEVHIFQKNIARK